jgi:hypothetical protein
MLPGLVAYYWDGGVPAPHAVREVSLTGMYLLTEERWYLGTVVLMRLQQSNSTETDTESSVAVHAKVIRWGTDGVGMAFLPPGQDFSGRGRDPQSSGANKKSLERFVQGPE